MANGGGWDEDEAPPHNPHGYTEDPEEPEIDETRYACAPADALPPTTRVEAPPTPEPQALELSAEAPPPIPVELASTTVVDINTARQRKSTPALPEVTGLPSFRAAYPSGLDPLLVNLRESELTDETINAAKLTVIHHSNWRAYGFRCKPSEHWQRPDLDALISGVLLPFFAPGASQPHGYRLRPETKIPVPKTNPKQKQRFKKYDQPYGTELLVYTPPLAACLSQLQSDTPLYWTEGEKKALLIGQLGMCVVGLTGVDSWSVPGSKSTQLHGYIAQHYRIAGRHHVIVYDSDAHTNKHVQLAMRKLAGVLTQLGAASVTMALPPFETEGKAVFNKGIDDYAHAHGVEAARLHLQETRDVIEVIEPRANEKTLEKVAEFSALTQVKDFVLPAPYSVDKAGAIWLHSGFEDSDKRLVTPRPIFVTRIFRDPHRNGEFRVEIQFQTASFEWRAVVVPRSLTGSRGLAAELRRQGATVDDWSIGDVIRWLTAWEARNGDKLTAMECVDRTGWVGRQFGLAPDLVFAPAGEAAVAFDIHFDQSRLFNALGSKSTTLDTDAATHARALQVAADASPDCALAIFAALTAPLLKPFALPNFAVHLCGDSSRGKTSMLRCAASVFGNPNNSAWVPSWNMTLSGLEQHAVQLCDLPLCFDEAGVGDPEAIQTAIYMLINGVGRTRSTKELTMRRALSWQTVVISTGERELASESAATGAQVRVISLPITGFGELDGAGVDAVRDACAQHAGAFGMAWLRKVVDIAGDPSALLKTKVRLAEHQAVLRVIARESGNPLNNRIADYFAAMMLAEDLASELGLGLPGGETVRRVFEQRCGIDQSSTPSTLLERVLNVLTDWPAQAPSAFPQTTLNNETGKREASMASRPVVHGYVREDGALCFIPESLKTYLESKGLAWTRALARDLHMRGLLVKVGSDATYQLRINGTKVRVYLFAPQPDDGEE